MNIYKIKMLVKRNKLVRFLLRTKMSRTFKEKATVLRAEGVKVISEVEKTLINQGYLYYAACGTLLGIVRDNNFIKDDIDIDYCVVTTNDFDWIGFELNLNKNGFKKIRQFKVNGIIREQTYQNGQLTVDFFTLFKIDNQWYSYGFHRIDGYLYSNKNEFSIREVSFVPVEETVRTFFNGIEVSIPRNFEDVLVCYYGNSWKIPNPKWDDNSMERKNIRNLDILAEVQFFD